MSKVKQCAPSDKVEVRQPQVAATLQELAREGARRMLQQALLSEVAEHVQSYKELRDEAGHAVVVRNGRAPRRKVVMGSGPVEVIAPRVDDRGLPQDKRFRSQILPRYARRAPEVSTVLPALYLRGLSSGDFREGLSALLGKDAAGLSASTVTRLTQQWTDEYEVFRQRRYQGEDFVYLWVDGVHLNIRLEEDRLSLLVVIGAQLDGSKRLLALEDGYRESKESWLSVLRSLKERGLCAPVLAVGDGALGFWSAMREIYPQTRSQRCFVHKMCNVLDKLPKRLQPRAKAHLRRMMYAGDRHNCESEKASFQKEYAKYPKALESLSKDWESLMTYYDFPAEHWKHLRTTNPIESPFATLRHRQRRTKGNGSRRAGLAMAYKLLDNAERSWRRLDGAAQLVFVRNGVRFVDGDPDCSPQQLERLQLQAQAASFVPAPDGPTQATR